MSRSALQPHQRNSNTTQDPPSSSASRDNSTTATAVTKQPVPNFTTYLPPSPPRSRSPSPYSRGGSSTNAHFEQQSSAGPRLRMSSTATSTYLQPQGSQQSHPSERFPSPSSSTGSSAALAGSSTAAMQRRPSQNGSEPLYNSKGAESSQIEAGPSENRPNEYLHHVNFHHPNSMPHPNGYANGYANGYGDYQHQSTSPTMGATPSIAKAPIIGAIYNKANGIIKDVSFAPSSSTNLPTHTPMSATHLSASASSHSAHNRRKSVAQIIAPSISTVRFASLCALWYTSSAVSSNTGKSIMNRFKYPVTLTFIQFGFVAGWCIIVCVARAKFAQMSSRGSNGHGHSHHVRALSVSQMHSASGWGIKKPSKKALEGTLIMSGFQIAGHIFSSMAIARVPVSTVHTIKALSPLFTVMSYGLLFRVRYSYNTYMSLLPLTVGVMLACSFDLRANAAGLVCALGSTLVFVSQNIFSKKLLPKEGRSEHGSSSDGKLDKLHLLLYSSGLAFLLMIPLWAYYDGYKLLFGTNVIRTASIPTLIFYYTLNGSVHFLQNLLAFSILSLCSPVTYSIASLIKRIAVICMAIVWFGQTVYPIQAVGISLTFLGLWMYNQAKKDVERGENVRTKVERRGSVLLPTSKEDLSDSDNPKAKGWAIVR